MKELRCGLKDCNFNKGYECKAARISVSDCADCVTYEPDGSKSKNDNIMYEAGMDNSFSGGHSPATVKCEAKKCLFNRAEHCVANGISVVSEDAGARCASYIDK